MGGAASEAWALGPRGGGGHLHNGPTHRWQQSGRSREAMLQLVNCPLPLPAIAPFDNHHGAAVLRHRSRPDVPARIRWAIDARAAPEGACGFPLSVGQHHGREALEGTASAAAASSRACLMASVRVAKDSPASRRAAAIDARWARSVEVARKAKRLVGAVAGMFWVSGWCCLTKRGDRKPGPSWGWRLSE